MFKVLLISIVAISLMCGCIAHKTDIVKIDKKIDSVVENQKEQIEDLKQVNDKLSDYNTDIRRDLKAHAASISKKIDAVSKKVTLKEIPKIDLPKVNLNPGKEEDKGKSLFTPKYHWGK